MDKVIIVGGGILLASVALRIAHDRARARGAPVPQPTSLVSTATDVIGYYPGAPSGYAAYTDHVAMNVTVNDSLIGRPPLEQFALLGFGAGFVSAMVERAVDEDLIQLHRFSVLNAGNEDRRRLGWLAFVQQKGTDNAPPSTENLQRVLAAIMERALRDGPIERRYREKQQYGGTDSPEPSGTSPEQLEVLGEECSRQRARGAHLAREAVLLS